MATLNRNQWQPSPKYAQGKRYEVPRKKRQDVDSAFGFLAAYADEQKFSVSRVDLKALGVGFVMGIAVVTDDVNMQQVAHANSIECWNTIKLLKLMVTTNHIDMDKVTEILEYLHHEHDLSMPKDRLRREFREYFGVNCPI